MVIPLLCLLSVACTSSEAEPSKPVERPAGQPDTPDDDPVRSASGHLTVSHTVGDVIAHEAFAGFGQFILPAERRYDDDLPLRDVASMLPYHNYVTGERAVETLNRMIDYVHDGNRLFYDIYSDAEKRADTRKNNTGLFFFRGEPGRPFAVV